MRKSGEQFLHKNDSRLHLSQPVEHESQRKRRSGEKVSQKPAEKIADWLRVLEITHTRHRDDPRVVERIKNFYHKKFVIKAEGIPASYYDNQKRLARELGHGDIEIDEEAKERLSEVIISDQESTLDNWINYFISEDSSSYPTWAKYWAFNGMLKLSAYDKEKHAFGKRDNSTVAPFPDLNREALSYAIDVIVKKADDQEIGIGNDDPELMQLLKNSNFGKLYAYAIEKVTPAKESELQNTKGEWRTYQRNSDHMPLVESLQGHGTGWCTAGETTAKSQLAAGDFHVFYSYDKSGAPTIPRVAIRMQENHIAEVRGIAHEQNLDPYIENVVEEKLAGFPDGDWYKKKTADMKLLTTIDLKNNKGIELSDDDLKFLYQLNSKIEGFGNDDDPRIAEIMAGRDAKSDLPRVFGCSPEQISTTNQEALKGNIFFHIGDLVVRDTKIDKNLKLPQIIGGDLHIYNMQFLESVDGLRLPERVGGNLIFDCLKSAQGVILPEIVGGDFSFSALENAEGIVFPKEVGGRLILTSARSVKGAKLPEIIGGDVILKNLESAIGLELPNSIDGSVDLSNLKSADDLKLPDEIGYSLNLSSIRSIDGLRLPSSIEGELILSGLESAKGLKLTNYTEISFDLSGLKSTAGLELPDEVFSLILTSLESAEGLKLPKIINNDLVLPGLRSAEGLTLPDEVFSLILTSLESAEGLKLPKIINNDLVLPGLRSAEGLTLPDEVGNNLNLSGLVSANGLKLPRKVGRDLYLTDLKSAEGVELPEEVGGVINLRSLESAIGLKLPKVVGGRMWLGGLKSSVGLELPEKVSGKIFVNGLPPIEIESLKNRYPKFAIVG